uniref:ATP-dependent DNA helicase n=1 Tax=Trypanosoma congolense (strain IL3000) TaxID=1068625 RepID=G0UVA3_TRYCI|nr:unnamed protein product [Trypanosoma congolense IL3000]
MSLHKPKMTPSSVRGRIRVTAEDGERIGPWGGTECFLSRQVGIGPCLVVRSSRHKRHQGTFFRLVGVQEVISTYTMEGKLTVVVPHEKRLCTLFIETGDDIGALQMMAATLQDRSQWKDMERNVACKKARRSRTTIARDRQVNDAFEGYDYDDGCDERDWVSDDDKAAEKVEHSGANQAGIEEKYRKEVEAMLHIQQEHGNGLLHVGSSWNSTGMEWTSELTEATRLVCSGNNVFITGSAGTGKTKWLTHLIKNVLPQDESTVVTAATGIASRQLNGCTIHSFAGIGRGEGGLAKVYNRVKSRQDIVRSWRQCKVLIIDEIGVISPELFSMLDEIARRLREAPDKPFGGIQVILLGDFLQLPPVNPAATGNEWSSGNGPVVAGNEAKWCFESPSWDELQLALVEFQKSYRHEKDPEFAQCLDDIRFGRYTRRVERIMKECCAASVGKEHNIEPTMLVARRMEAARHNEERLKLLDYNTFHRYTSEDTLNVPNVNLDKEVSLQQWLELRVGAQVVLLASIPDAPYLANGDQGIVVSFVEKAPNHYLPVVCFTESNEEVLIPVVKMDVLSHDGRVIASREQIPLQLSWAMTVHRAQGMTLPLVRVHLDRSFFDSGQAYVAVSRVRQRKDLLLSKFDPEAILADGRAVAFYEKHFPRKPRSDGTAEDELVAAPRKRPRPYEGEGGDDVRGGAMNDGSQGAQADFAGNQQFSSQKSDVASLILRPLSRKFPLEQLPRMSDCAIPTLTQESGTGENNSQTLRSFSQRALMIDDE